MKKNIFGLMTPTKEQGVLGAETWSTTALPGEKVSVLFPLLSCSLSLFEVVKLQCESDAQL